MHNRTFVAQWQRQRGFSLTEILVAVAIFTIIMVAALTLYDRSNRVFKQANEAAEMQQNTRVAFEKVVSEVRMAGFDYKRAGTPAIGNPTEWIGNREYSIGSMVIPTTVNGHVYVAIQAGTSTATEPTWPTGNNDVVCEPDADPCPTTSLKWQERGAPSFEQPDEQIEYISQAALTLRANFDYETDTTENKGRETDLESASGGHFPVITIGNDEIVTYALKSTAPNAAAANDDTISFFADVNEGGTPDRVSYPGGDPERLVEIEEIDLDNNAPPYQLMRYTLSPTGVPEGVVIAENIRSLQFQYWEDFAATVPLKTLAGATIAQSALETTVGGLGMYDPDDPDLQIDGRILRSKIRAVTVTLVGMNPQPDREYTHPDDTVATNYRQYELTSTIVGRNLGLKGVPSESSNAPEPPVLDSVCYGYCGVVVVSWTPAEGTTDTTYTVLADDNEDGSFSLAFPAGTATRFAVDMTEEDMTKTWYFKVAATNAGGTTLSDGDPIEANIKNATKPGTPYNATAATSLASDDTYANKIVLTWTLPATNGGGTTPTCVKLDGTSATPYYTKIPNELKGFRIYRSQTSGFSIDATTPIVTESDAGITTDSAGNYTYTDTSVANCETYYYRIVAVEHCDTAAENNPANAALGESDGSIEDSGRAMSVSAPDAPTNLKYDPTDECSDTDDRCNPVHLSWDAVISDAADATIYVSDYKVYRQKMKGSSPVGSKQTIASIHDGSTTYVDNEGLREHDTDGVDFTYNYSVQAFYGIGSCDTPGIESTVLSYPGGCSTWGSVDVADSTSGSGEEGDPYTDVSSIIVTENVARPLTSVKYIINPDDVTSVWQTVSGPPFNVAWDDVGDGSKYEVKFELQALVGGVTCTEYQTLWIENDAPSCTPGAMVMNVDADKTKLQLYIRNFETSALTLEDFTITWAGQTGMTWSTITLPSTTSAAGSGGTVAAEKKFTVTGTDKDIPANSASYGIKMNFSGTQIASPSAVTNLALHYFTADGFELTGCNATPLVVCRLTSTVGTPANSWASGNPNVGDTSRATMTFTNGTSEVLTVKKIKLTTTAINKWTWKNITLASGTVKTVTATENTNTTAEVDVSGDSVTIPANSTYSISVQWEKTSTGGGASAPASSNVTFGQMKFTTPNSGTTEMVCITQ